MKKSFVRERIKDAARIHLAGNWLKSFAITAAELILFVLVFSRIPFTLPLESDLKAVGGDINRLIELFFPQGVTPRLLALIGVTIVLYLMVISPLAIGKCKFFLRVAKGEKGKLAEVFSVYADLKTVFSAVWLKILVFAISVFWIVAFSLIPTAIMLIGIYVNSLLIIDVAALLAPVASLFGVLWCTRYTFAEYILAEGERGAFASLRECILLTRHRKLECVALRLSYILWDVAAFYIFPFKFVYLSLYGTVYAKYLLFFRADMARRAKTNPPA